MNGQLLRAAEAARILGLGIHPRTVVRLVERNQIDGVRLGGLTMVRRSALEKLIGNRIPLDGDRVECSAMDGSKGFER